MKSIKIANKNVGQDYPCFIIAEIGINHNGSIKIAKQLIDVASDAGCDAVKFQKRTPSICVPKKQKNILRETPWGLIKYIDYKKKIELGIDEYQEIDTYCKKKKILWFASCWDIPSINFIKQFKPCCYKIASASLTDDVLLQKIKERKKPIILSTGMSTIQQINHAVNLLCESKLILLHTTSSYPCCNEELNLKMINTLNEKYSKIIGYSGHELGLQVSIAAVALGAKVIERHITLNRAMWGTDQSASIEPQGLRKMIRDIRVIESALGDGVKKIYNSELKILKKLRFYK